VGLVGLDRLVYPLELVGGLVVLFDRYLQVLVELEDLLAQIFGVLLGIADGRRLGRRRRSQDGRAGEKENEGQDA